MTKRTNEQPLTLEVGGIDFHALMRGEQPETVFLHGFGSNLHTWDLLWPYLDSSKASLRYDLRGYGETPEPGTELFSHSEDFIAILDHLEVERCNLVGLSMGGSVALNVALDHPDRIDKLVLISPGLMAWDWSETWRAQWKEIVTEARTGRMDEARHLWWQHPLFESTRESAAATALYNSIRKFSGRQWVRDYSRQAIPETERLHQLQVPSLMLTGQRDLEEFRLMASVIEASVEHLTRIDLPGVGHLLHMEEPAGCAGHIDRFLHAVDG